MERIRINESIAPKLREWFSAGRGVKVWRNAEIGGRRPNSFTPADTGTSPHWSAPTGEDITPDMIDVETFTERTRFRGRLKQYYWGHGLAPVTENKAKRLLRAGEHFFWEYAEDGLAHVLIGTLDVVPFAVAVGAGQGAQS